LSNRQQFTVVEGSVSSLAKITCGVPQGSVLGPLLFLLYINDIANAVPDLNVKLFADDTNLFITDKDPPLLNSTANEAINKLNNWFIANRLSLNVDKTCYMVFSPHKNACCVNFKLLLGGLEIRKVKSCRYIGLIIDDELKWSVHIDHIYNYLLKYVGMFYKLQNKVPGKCHEKCSLCFCLFVYIIWN